MDRYWQKSDSGVQGLRLEFLCDWEARSEPESQPPFPTGTTVIGLPGADLRKNMKSFQNPCKSAQKNIKTSPGIAEAGGKALQISGFSMPDTPEAGGKALQIGGFSPLHFPLAREPRRGGEAPPAHP